MASLMRATASGESGTRVTSLFFRRAPAWVHMGLAADKLDLRLGHPRDLADPLARDERQSQDRRHSLRHRCGVKAVPEAADFLVGEDPVAGTFWRARAHALRRIDLDKVFGNPPAIDGAQEGKNAVRPDLGPSSRPPRRGS